ncbi:hypothetical protein B0H11DRAFT_2196879 [Mycena galericulata]|nr:hypothetical protein B0H11DRAFT_2196879 [Mycena galericulata]
MTTVYTGLREFHESRGFDPDSQDMAHHLGHLIYKVSDGESSTTDDEDSCDSPIQALNENTIEELPSVDLSTLYGPEDMLPLSRTSKFLMVVKLALVLFIALSCNKGGNRKSRKVGAWRERAPVPETGALIVVSRV